jgi:hypothetical protein
MSKTETKKVVLKGLLDPNHWNAFSERDYHVDEDRIIDVLYNFRDKQVIITIEEVGEEV